jgi:hypothetical protein
MLTLGEFYLSILRYQFSDLKEKHVERRASEGPSSFRGVGTSREKGTSREGKGHLKRK